MADVTLYYNPRCPYARRVRLVLEHLEVEYDTVDIDLDAVPQDFRSVSPYGLVPAITHEGANIYESNIINEYLDEVYHGGLMPESPLGRAQTRILMAYADDHWIPPVVALKRAMDAGAPKQEVRALQQDVLKRLREIETKFREGGPYLLGRALSLADVAFATTIVDLPRYGMHIPDGLLRTKRWAGLLAALPALTRMEKELDQEAKRLHAADRPGTR